MSLSRIAILGLVALGGAPAHAQPAADGAPYLGPVRCYIDATQRSNLPTLKAKQLCIGSAGEAPARCFTEAIERVRMTDDQAVRLCQAATSTEPAACAERLDAATALVSTTIVDYCAALHWPILPAGTGGSAACVEAALDRTLLVNTEAARLCAGSVSTEPVACFELGADKTLLSDSDLVDLCAVVVIATPYGPLAP